MSDFAPRNVWFWVKTVQLTLGKHPPAVSVQANVSTICFPFVDHLEH